MEGAECGDETQEDNRATQENGSSRTYARSGSRRGRVRKTAKEDRQGQTENPAQAETRSSLRAQPDKNSKRRGSSVPERIGVEPRVGERPAGVTCPNLSPLNRRAKERGAAAPL